MVVFKRLCRPNLGQVDTQATDLFENPHIINFHNQFKWYFVFVLFIKERNIGKIFDF